MSIWRPLSVLPLLFISAIAQFSFEFSGHHDVKPKVSLSADIHDLPNVLDFFPEHREDILGDEAAATKGGRKRDSSSVKTDYLGKWELFSRNSGVSAMHAILLPVINKVLMYDATIWRISQIKLPPGKRCHIVKQATGKKDCWAHAVLLDINTAALKPLMVPTTIISFSFYLFLFINQLNPCYIFYFRYSMLTCILLYIIFSIGFFYGKIIYLFNDCN